MIIGSGGPALDVIGVLWSLWGVYWVISAIGRAPARRRESPLSRMAHVAVTGTAFYLLASGRWPALSARFLPRNPVFDWLGVLLTFAGVAVSVWARQALGRNWSADVTIRQDHTLVRSGPYASVRHPIYTGILLSLLGTAIAIGEWRALVALGVVAVGFTFKARKEERFLAEEFGPVFEEHRKRTGFLLPRLHPGS